MDKWQKKGKSCLALVGVFLSIISSSCVLDLRKEVEQSSELRFYSIDSSNILESLAQGRTDIFTLLETTPDTIISTPIVPISWNQNDYFHIAQKFYQLTLGEALSTQNLYNMGFSMNCSDIERGTFSQSDIYFYKINQTGKGKTRIEYKITILPLRKLVITLKQEFSPNVYDYPSIDLSRYKVSAEEALQIAENNGGREKRSGVENACKINAITPGIDKKGWNIIYLNANNIIEEIFEIEIDPQTADFKVLYTKP